MFVLNAQVVVDCALSSETLPSVAIGKVENSLPNLYSHTISRVNMIFPQFTHMDLTLSVNLVVLLPHILIDLLPDCL